MPLLAAGLYPSMAAAQAAMTSGFEETFYPNPARVEVYEKLYRRYVALGGFIEKQSQSTQYLPVDATSSTDYQTDLI